MSAFPAKRTVALLSGGLDSVVAMAEALQTGAVVLALTFDYGQRARVRELAASRALAEHYGIEHQVVELPWLATLVPKGLSAQAEFGAGEGEGVTRVWVPNRNGVFLNIAAAYAESLRANTVVFGANADEAVDFPDNTQTYRDRLNAALAFSTLNGVMVETPVGHLTKAQILERGQTLGVPLERIWSCYEGTEAHCGLCPSCLLLKHALARLPKQSVPSIAFAD